MRMLVRIGFAAVLATGLLALASRPAIAQAPAAEKQPAQATAKSKLKITVSMDDAELLIEDKATKATGKVREFETPPLEVGKPYEYKFTVKLKPNNYTTITRIKNVPFKGGEEVVVDMAKEDPTDKAFIRYVPTPDDIVAEMIKLGKVGKDDVIYEPGCGDARLTIAAVKAGAKKGVGIDLDPERITEAKANVKAAKLEDKVEIRLADALDLKDLGDTTVVLMYMGNEFDALIRPVFWKQLKVGTRIVSHRFTMGDWKPDESKKIVGADSEEYEIHVWTITKEIKDKAEKAK